MTSTETAGKLTYKLVDGFKIPNMFSEDTFRGVLKYKPRDDDLFIVTYPKCGTTWAQHIILLILRQGQPIPSFNDLMIKSPFLEFAGVESAELMPRPGALKVHLPYHLTPRSDKAKYIYVVRNPKDCCVSYYYHMKSMPLHGFDGTFDDFFEMFISGNIDYGDYFDHLIGWYEHRNDPNVLYMTYEEMKNDIKAATMKMASFIDDETYAEPMRKDPEILNNVIQYSSLEHMRTSVNKSIDEMFAMKKEDVLKMGEIPEAMKEMFLKVVESAAMNSDAQKEQKASTFVRKGIIGDWRNHLSVDQNRRLEEKFEERTKGTDIPSFWKNMM